MTPRELLAAGDFGAAVAAQSALLRAKPTDLDARWFLFVLLCFAGELDRAILQLDMLTEQNAEFGMGSVVYRSLVTAEAERAAVLTRSGNPLLPPNSGAHVEARLAALHALPAKAWRTSRTRRCAAVGQARGGVAELFDTDELFGPILEVLAGGHYLWLPLDRVRSSDQAGRTPARAALGPAARDVSGVTASILAGALPRRPRATRLRSGQMTDWRGRGVHSRASQRVLLARRGDLERTSTLCATCARDDAGAERGPAWLAPGATSTCAPPCSTG
jgi:type VI secretion system protein ImpE